MIKDPLPPLIDSHCHLDFRSFAKEEIPLLLERATQAGLVSMIHIGSGEGTTSFQNAIELVQNDPQLYTTLGIHPHDAKLCDQASLSAIKVMASHNKVVAIGEVGLDYYYEHSDRKQQQEVLRNFASLAKEVKKPLSIHLRDADEDFLKIFHEEKMWECGGVIHCFSSNLAFAQKMIENNFYISFSGIVTFPKKTETIQEAARHIPLDKILIETDSPYLAPIPYRGKRNEPAFVKHVAEKIAELRGISFAEVATQTTKNAKQLFRLDQ